MTCPRHITTALLEVVCFPSFCNRERVIDQSILARQGSLWRQYHFLSTPGTSLSKTPIITSANEIAHEWCSWPIAWRYDDYFESLCLCVCLCLSVCLSFSPPLSLFSFAIVKTHFCNAGSTNGCNRDCIRRKNWSQNDIHLEFRVCHY